MLFFERQLTDLLEALYSEMYRAEINKQEQRERDFSDAIYRLEREMCYEDAVELHLAYQNARYLLLKTTGGWCGNFEDEAMIDRELSKDGLQ